MTDRQGREGASAGMNGLRGLGGGRRKARLGRDSGRGGGGGLAGLAAVAELLDGAVEAIQAEGLAVEEQNGVVLLVVLAAALEGHLGFPQLVVVKLHRHPVLLRLPQRSALRLVDRRRLELVCTDSHIIRKS